MTRLPGSITCGKVFVHFGRTKNRMHAVVDIDGDALRADSASPNTLRIMLIARLDELAHDLQRASTDLVNLR